jgi:hypothetical protein
VEGVSRVTVVGRLQTSANRSPVGRFFGIQHSETIKVRTEAVPLIWSFRKKGSEPASWY